MDKVEQAKITRGGWSSLGFTFCLLLFYVFGIHLGQIAAIANPWPDNMAALFWNAPFSGRGFRGVGMVVFMLFMTATLAGYPAFQSAASLMDTIWRWRQRMDRRHVAVIVGVFLFALPLLISGGMVVPRFLSGLALLVLGGALFINIGIAGRAALGVGWILAGFVLSDGTVRRSYDLDEECRPDAQIMLKNGQNLACTAIQELGLYNGVLIRSDAGSTFMPISELEPQSVIEAVGPMGKLLF